MYDPRQRDQMVSVTALKHWSWHLTSFTDSSPFRDSKLYLKAGSNITVQVSLAHWSWYLVDAINRVTSFTRSPLKDSELYLNPGSDITVQVSLAHWCRHPPDAAESRVSPASSLQRTQLLLVVHTCASILYVAHALSKYLHHHHLVPHK